MRILEQQVPLKHSKTPQIPQQEKERGQPIVE
jgi:hypothetical protein